MKKIFSKILTLISIFFICSCSAPKTDIYHYSDVIKVKKISNLNDDFVKGIDVSSIISLEKSGVKFYDYENNQIDVFDLLSKSGFTHIRVRIWNNPYDKNGNYYGGGNADILNAVEIAKRTNNYGLKLIIDFHYSDFWADPGKQKAPKLWSNYNLEEKKIALYNFTKECLEELKKYNSNISIVQMGNEINNGMCGVTSLDEKYQLINESYKAIKEVCPNAEAALHFTEPQKDGYFEYIFKSLVEHNVQYDIFGTSYYPFWHGTLKNLKNVLSYFENAGKKTMVLETSYPYTLDDSDFHENTIREETKGISKPYNYSLQGQANLIHDVVDTISKLKGGSGVCYWEGAWIPVGTNSKAENEILWEKCGSGWASSFASEYDESAAKYHGGSAVDNQALFDKNGKALDTLKIFNLLQ